MVLITVLADLHGLQCLHVFSVSMHGFNIAVCSHGLQCLHGFDNSFSSCRFAVFALFAGFSCIVLSVYNVRTDKYCSLVVFSILGMVKEIWICQ